jgi:hypothetical protein
MQVSEEQLKAWMTCGLDGAAGSHEALSQALLPLLRGFYRWPVMSKPLNEAMLLGNATIPKLSTLHRYVADAVRVFLAAHGMHRAPNA